MQMPYRVIGMLAGNFSESRINAVAVNAMTSDARGAFRLTGFDVSY